MADSISNPGIPDPPPGGAGSAPGGGGTTTPPGYVIDPVTGAYNVALSPDQPSTGPQPSRVKTNKNHKQQATIAGAGNVIPLLYGRRRVGGRIAGIVQGKGTVYFLVVWCWGTSIGVDAIESYQVGNDQPQTDGHVSNYLGSQTMPDPDILSAFASGIFVSSSVHGRRQLPQTYFDILPGVCYSVIGVGPKGLGSLPTFAAIVRGMKVASTDGGSKAYSTCPAYIVADFITNADYGMGAKVNWNDVAMVASYNTSMVGSTYSITGIAALGSVAIVTMAPGGPDLTPGDTVTVSGATGSTAHFYNGTFEVQSVLSPSNQFTYNMTGAPFFSATGTLVLRATEARNTLNLCIDTVKTKQDWLDILCNYAECFPYKDGDTWRLALDAPSAASPMLSLTESDLLQGSLKLTKSDIVNIPTVMDVIWTDTTQVPWADEHAVAYAPGVLAGTVTRRVTQMDMRGIVRYSEAYRYAVKRLNQGLLSDLSCTFTMFDKGIKLTVGDVFELTHPVGLVNKQFRCTKVDPISTGRWAVSGIEYDAAAYSNDVVSTPSSLDVYLPSPFGIPDVTGLMLREDVYQVQTGRYASRLVVTWTGPTIADWTDSGTAYSGYALLDGFDVQLESADQFQQYKIANNVLSFTSGALQEGVSYTVRVRARSLLADGGFSTASITITGKPTVPSNVSSLTGSSIGGQEKLVWTAVPDLDVSAYELRWGLTSDTWGTAKFLARVASPATTYDTTAIPGGSTQRIFIKALDSVRTTDFPNGQESAIAAYVDLLITINPLSRYTNYDPGTPTLSNMVAVPEGWVTDMGNSWNSLFTGAINGYTSPLWDYHADGLSGLVSETVDIGGIAINASVICTLAYQNLTGAATPYIEYKQTISEAWTRSYGLSASGLAFRYVRVGIVTTVMSPGSGTLLVTSLGVISVGIESNGNYVVGMKLEGLPTTLQILIYHPFPGIVSYLMPGDALNSICTAKVAATADTNFDLQKNGVSIGTIRFLAGHTSAVFIGIAETTFVGSTDYIEVVAPASPDATLANLGFSLYLTVL